MAEPLPVPLEPPNPLHGARSESPQANPEPPQVITPVPIPDSGPSPIGSLRQYSHGESLPSDWNKTSLTGATMDDPTGSKTRQPVLSDPEWASPLAGFKALITGRIFSFVLYWIGYGFSLMLVMAILWLVGGAQAGSPLGASAAVLFVGPVIGLLLDLEIFISGSWMAVAGLILLLAEPILFYFYLFSDDSRERLRYFGAAVALVCVKTVIYALVSSSG